MVGKNNKKLLREKQSNKVYKYAIKRLTFGVASVAISAGLMFAGGTVVGAEEAPIEETPATEVNPQVEEPAEEPEVPEVPEEPEEPAEEPIEQEGSEEEAATADAEVLTSEITDALPIVEDVQFTKDQKARLAAAGYEEYEIARLEAQAQVEAQTVADVEVFVIQKIQEKEAEKEETPEVANGADLGLELGDKNVPEAVGGAEERAGLTEDQKKKATQSANNWEEVISSEDDYWEIPKVDVGSVNEEGKEVKYWKGRNMGGLTSVGYATTELNYLGNYTDEKGNDVIRLQIQADTRSYTASWMDNVDLAFKFQKDLFDAIDWDKSYVYSAKGTEQHFNFNNVKASDYQAGISFTQIKSNVWLNQLYELPMNLVLKKGYKISDLGKKDFLIQHRALDTKNKMILTNVPGAQRDVNLNEIEYGQFTKGTT